MPAIAKCEGWGPIGRETAQVIGLGAEYGNEVVQEAIKVTLQEKDLIKEGQLFFQEVEKNAIKIAEAIDTGKVRWGYWSQLEKVTIDGKKYAKIGDYYYTRHAIERIYPSELGTVPHPIKPFETRGIPTFAIEETIKFGEIVPSANSKYVAKKLGDIKVVIEDNNIIISVFRESK